MGSDHWKEQEELALDSSYWDIPVDLPPRQFTAFGQKLDRQLQQLVLRWAHLATYHDFAWRRECGGTSVVGPASEP